MPILTEHNDGGCFKLTIVYTDYEEAESFQPHIRWSEDFAELWVYAAEEMNRIHDNGHYVIDIRIQDDSK